MAELCVELNIWCDSCAGALEVKQGQTPDIFYVVPCEVCLAEAYEEGEQEAVKWI